MQLMPATARSLGVTDPFDPAQNVDGGTRHLGSLIAHYSGDLTKALAAYNAGQGAVARHRGVPPYRETQAYVKKVLRRYNERKTAPAAPAATPATPPADSAPKGAAATVASAAAK
jgi:soluble lytic murein transglycosylase-like protein